MMQDMFYVQMLAPIFVRSCHQLLFIGLYAGSTFNCCIKQKQVLQQAVKQQQAKCCRDPTSSSLRCASMRIKLHSCSTANYPNMSPSKGHEFVMDNLWCKLKRELAWRHHAITQWLNYHGALNYSAPWLLGRQKLINWWLLSFGDLSPRAQEMMLFESEDVLRLVNIKAIDCGALACVRPPQWTVALTFDRILSTYWLLSSRISKRSTVSLFDS